jgi:3-oxoacyl-[acyl-carrier protein] reductase
LPDKITANCVAPGLIGTERDPKLPLPQHHGVNRILTGRLGSVEDRSCGMFLAGPRARSIIG